MLSKMKSTKHRVKRVRGAKNKGSPKSGEGYEHDDGHNLMD